MLKNKIKAEDKIKAGVFDNSISTTVVAERLSKKTGLKITRQLVRHWRMKENELKPFKPVKIVGLDIETAPTKGYVWGAWQQNLGKEQFIRDWYILSFCAMPLGGKPEYHDKSESWQTEDDSLLLKRLWEILDDADIIVAQNGRKFDAKKIRTRFLLEGFPPPSPFRIVDTLETLRGNFAFDKNNLDFVSDRLCRTKKRKHGKFPGFSLWDECLKGNKAAWKEMRLYNIDDVVALLELYIALRPWDNKHPNVAVYHYQDKPHCGRCGSAKLHLTTKQFRSNVGVYDMYQCLACGGWGVSRTLQNSAKTRKTILRNN
jgi:hypothetical protein